MKNTKRLFTLITVLLIGVLLTSCSKTTENEHLPEYCRTYSGFMEFASEDLYNLVGGINRDNYLSVISSNEEVFYGYDKTCVRRYRHYKEYCNHVINKYGDCQNSRCTE